MPSVPTIDLDASSGRIRVTVTNTDTPTRNDIYAAVGTGSFIRVGKGVAVDGTFDYYNAPDDISVSFFARAVNGSTADSLTSSATLTLTGFWLHAVTKTSGTTTASGTVLSSLNNLIPEEEGRGRSSTLHDFAGATKPKVIGSSISDDEFGVIVRIPSGSYSTITNLEALFDASRYVCARDQKSNRFFGVIEELPISYQHGFADVGIRIVRVGFNEEIDE